MKIVLEKAIWGFITAYCHQNKCTNLWQNPVVKFADAANPLFQQLSTLVIEQHHVPQDYLKQATTVMSYFLPFVRSVGQSNREHEPCSTLWATAYLTANAMAAELNAFLVSMLREQGVAACVPTDAGMISEAVPKSRWSQRHVAYIAGHGTFGLNNMLISDRGSVGRYFSIITCLKVEPDPLVQEQRCLFKKYGTCKLCVQRCFTGALLEKSFDRFKCLEQCLKNDARYAGADVCGKCVVELPCSHA